MTAAPDLFSHRLQAQLSQPTYNWRTVGHGNAMVALDIAQGMTREEVRRRYKAGAYPDASAKFIADNLAYWGR